MIGQYVQNYKIVSHLGEGGMGVVYKAVDNVLGREVALKMLHTSMIRQPQVLDRFKKEAQVLARLLHPNIAVIYNFIEQDEQYFMVMEYVEGKNLDTLARAHEVLPPKTIVAMFLQALEGLHHAHKKGITHRDIKPSNLILTPEGTVKLMDFGIAKIAGEQKLTQVNRVIGTVEFMAPEIIEGKEPSVASDIYASGVTMYEMLSGRLPFANTSDYNLMQDILKKKPDHLKALNASIPPALSNIVMKALEKKPENRFKDAREFQQALLAAFPGYKDVDLSILAPAAQPLYVTREGPVTGGFNGNSPTVLSSSMETRMETAPAATTVMQRFDQKILQNKKSPYILTAIGLLLFLLIFLFVKLGGKPPEIKSIAGTMDTVKKVTPEDHTGGSPVLTQQVIPEPSHAIVLPDEKKQVPAEEDKPGKKGTDKRSEKKEKEPAKKEVSVPVAPVEEKKPDPPPPVKKTEKKEITIDYKVEVSVSMRETITRDEDDKEQSVSFTVTSPVVYEGVTIIRAGAVARGSIRIGRKISMVTISSVVAANGQEIQLRGRDHRKVKELASNRDYTAFVEKGLRMSF
jgi:tRNA A-37 threonylcarbamoyl transferase component Bud32